MRPDLRSKVELEREKAGKRANSGNKSLDPAFDLFTTKSVVLPLLRLENLLPFPIKVRLMNHLL